jgi:DNA-directed RNA polymerase specialized sigma24 family protein
MYNMTTGTESGTILNNGFNGPGSLYRKYLRGISLLGKLRSLIVDRSSFESNRRSRRVQLVTEAGSMAAELGGSNMLNWQALKNAVEQLPQDYRIIFGLHDIYGYKHEEIANKLGISISDSKSQLHVARLRLRTLLFQN